MNANRSNIENPYAPPQSRILGSAETRPFRANAFCVFVFVCDLTLCLVMLPFFLRTAYFKASFMAFLAFEWGDSPWQCLLIAIVYLLPVLAALMGIVAAVTLFRGKFWAIRVGYVRIATAALYGIIITEILMFSGWGRFGGPPASIWGNLGELSRELAANLGLMPLYFIALVIVHRQFARSKLGSATHDRK